jgi:hypothetical protein
MTDVAGARDRRWIALILLCSAQFVVVLDASIVNVAGATTITLGPLRPTRPGPVMRTHFFPLCGKKCV